MWPGNDHIELNHPTLDINRLIKEDGILNFTTPCLFRDEKLFISKINLHNSMSSLSHSSSQSHLFNCVSAVCSATKKSPTDHISAQCAV